MEFSSGLSCCIKLRVVVVEILRRPACCLPSVVLLSMLLWVGKWSTSNSAGSWSVEIHFLILVNFLVAPHYITREVNQPVNPYDGGPNVLCPETNSVFCSLSKLGCFTWEHGVWRPDFLWEEIRGGGCGVSFWCALSSRWRRESFRCTVKHHGS